MTALANREAALREKLRGAAGSSYFPEVRGVYDQGTYVEVGIDEDYVPDAYLEAFREVFGVGEDAVTLEYEGGCDSCGWGALATVTVRGVTMADVDKVLA